MKKIVLTTVTLMIGMVYSNAQNVNIPDANFKAYLVGNTMINTNMDAEIQVSEATVFNGLMNCSGLNISNLTGISAFTSLTNLNCSSNLLTSLDISNNTALTVLHCYYNSISNIDFSNNTSLTDLRCFGNDLTSLDVSLNPALTVLSITENLFSSINLQNGNNTAITQFYAGGNPNLTCIQVDDATYSTSNWTNIDASASFSESCPDLCTVNIPDANFKAYLVGNAAINTNLDSEIQCSEATAFTSQIWIQAQGITDLTGIEAFTNLTSLNCNSNSLTVIDVSNNTSLAILNIAGNSINTLDISSNTALSELVCDYNDISTLDVSNNSNLTKLYVSDNLLTSLDVSNNTQLIELGCESNNLITLNVKNGNNVNFTGFYVEDNPNLTCIEVDNSTYSTTNWTYVDATTSFSENCAASAAIQETKAVTLSIYPNPASSDLTIETEAIIESIEIFDINGSMVQNETTNNFSVASLTNGIYFIHVKTNEGVITERFIKN